MSLLIPGSSILLHLTEPPRDWRTDHAENRHIDPDTSGMRLPKTPAETEAETEAPKTNGGATIAWPDIKPLPDGIIPVETFNFEFLPVALRAWIKDASNRLQCPADYLAVAATTALGTLIGRRLGIKPQAKTDWIEVPNLWGMFIGPPGLMKSPAMNAALAPLHRLEANARGLNVAAREAYEISLRTFKLKKDAKNVLAKQALQNNPSANVDLDFGDEPKEPSPLRYITNDSSYEGLGELLISNPMGILVERDEIVSLLKHLEAEEHITARGFYLTGWSGQASYTIDRIGRGQRPIEAVCIGVIGNTQPTRMAEFVRRANADAMGGDGLIQRFGLMVWPDPPSTWENVDEYPDAEARDSAWQVFNLAAKINSDGYAMGQQDQFDPIRCLRFDDGALVEFSSWREKLEARLRSGELSPALEGHFAKYRKLVPVLALVNHVADEPGRARVSLEALTRALAFVTYLESHAKRVYGAGVLAEVVAAKAILKHIKKGDLTDGFNARDIQRKQWSNLSEKDHIAVGLNLLVDLNYLTTQERPTGEKGGRPCTVYVINPKLGAAP